MVNPVLYLPAGRQVNGNDKSDYTGAMQESGAAVLSVSEINRLAREALEDGVGHVAVAGEISNLARPASGHIYLSLKDVGAQLRCAFFRQRQRGLKFQPSNGDEVIAVGHISLYEPRGDYQLIVERLELAGSGALMRKFAELRDRLAAEGLFDPEQRRSLPPLPTRIGVITSPSGAAVRDILNVLRRRFPAIPVRIYPSAVQGAAAAGELVAALTLAGARADCDLLIVARGGGSLEDLWPFNEEPVVRAVASCPIPIVAGIGHETDVTLAELAADQRAPTPSGAAELAVPEWQSFAARATRGASALQAALVRRLERYAQRVDTATRRLNAASPAAALVLKRERLGLARLRLANGLVGRLKATTERLGSARRRLANASPRRLVGARQTRLAAASARLPAMIAGALATRSRRLAVAARTLDAVSPLATLGRGYALVTERGSGRVVRDAGDVQKGTSIAIRLAEGQLHASVDDTLDD